MFKVVFILMIISSLFLTAVAQNTSAVPGEFIVKLRAGVNAKQLFTSSASKAMFSKTKRIKGTNDRFVRVKLRDMSYINNLAAMAQSPAVQYIEPNYIYTLPKFKVHGVINQYDAPADEMYSKLWGLNNTKTGFDVDAPEAWSITKGSRKVVVAVVDTGIDYTHPDLKNNMWINEKELNGTDGVDDDGNGFVDDIYGYNANAGTGDPMDGHSHGTHCAGTIGAVHNSIGVAGVIANVRLMAVKIFSDGGSTSTAAIVEGIHYAADNGAHVMSNSWGGGGASQAISDSIKYAHSKGIPFVAAAGNNGSDNDKRANYPSNYDIDNIIAVAAYQEDSKIASFSSYGQNTVDVAAPGVGILSTVPKGKYASYSGTSMATPHVSGVVALLLSLNADKWLLPPGQDRNTTLNPKEIRDLLIATSVKAESLSGRSVSNGRASAGLLLKAATKNLR